MQPPLWRGLAFVIGFVLAKMLIALFGTFGLVLLVICLIWLIIKKARDIQL